MSTRQNVVSASLNFSVLKLVFINFMTVYFVQFIFKYPKPHSNAWDRTGISNFPILAGFQSSRNFILGEAHGYKAMARGRGMCPLPRCCNLQLFLQCTVDKEHALGFTVPELYESFVTQS
jgi:hypothetical protein